jgi:outer membrane protein OmpA-like peptidoglycan-associated protein
MSTLSRLQSWSAGAALVLAAVAGNIVVAGQASAPPKVPLLVGLTIVTALNQPDQGDYESIKTFLKVNDKLAQLGYSAEVAGKDGGTPKQVHTTRTVLRRDLESATEYSHIFGETMSESLPGTTAVGVSRKVLEQLKTTGKSTLTLPAGGIEGALDSLLGGLLGGNTGLAQKRTGTIERVERTPVPFKVLLNDRAVELPAVHARGKLGDTDTEFWFLDDLDNPLSLKWNIGDDKLQVIRLAYPVPVADKPEGGDGPPPPDGRGRIAGRAGNAGSGPPLAPAAGASGSAAAGTAERIASELAKEGRAVIYGIYFDFNSDRIKEESEPVLAEIAQVMRQNPTWNLSVEGHTDSIASDAFNLELSKRRSAAVKAALTGRYAINGARLTTSGYGESRPRDRNDTLEGRAKNRRVELVKSN